jgi:hypothetical protein
MPAGAKGRAPIVRCLLLMVVTLVAGPPIVSVHQALAAASAKNEPEPHRVPRSLSHREIFQAIQDGLARIGISGKAGLQLADLRIQSTVPVLREDMGLKVERIGFDPLRRETVFKLWTSLQPQYLPFEVTTRRDPQSWGLTSELAAKLAENQGTNRAVSRVIGQGGSRPVTKPIMLAQPGAPATLIMLGQNVRITTTVVPLQPGTKGQSILVRDLTTARVMTAEVIDQDLLQTRF